MKVLQSDRAAPGNSPPITHGSQDDRQLHLAAAAFIIAVAIHGADHAFRGPDVLTSAVRLGGAIQFVSGVLAVVLVFRRHRWAPAAAALVGFGSALLFVNAHLLPTWSALSDSYLTPVADAGVSWFSWITAVLEISADLLFGWIGFRALMGNSRFGDVVLEKPHGN